jgi:hypothetical protein
MDYLAKFNETFVTFVEDLMQALPNDAELQLYQIAIKGIIMADKTLIRRMFHEKVTLKYEQHILNKNDDFFLNKDFSHYEQTYTQASQLIRKLKNSWVQLSDDNKQVVWKYFKVLLCLDKKYEELKGTSI